MTRNTNIQKTVRGSRTHMCLTNRTNDGRMPRVIMIMIMISRRSSSSSSSSICLTITIINNTTNSCLLVMTNHRNY